MQLEENSPWDSRGGYVEKFLVGGELVSTASFCMLFIVCAENSGREPWELGLAWLG